MHRHQGNAIGLLACYAQNPLSDSYEILFRWRIPRSVPLSKIQGLNCVFSDTKCAVDLVKCATLLECVMWSSKMQWRFLTEMLSLSWNRGKMNRFPLLNFKIFWRRCLQTPILRRGYGAPPRPNPLGTPALRASVPRSGPSAPPSSLSVCIVDILRYFRPWQNFNIIGIEMWVEDLR